jgi:hypothetical protein
MWLSLAWVASFGQSPIDQKQPPDGNNSGAAAEAKPSPADSLFLQLGHVGLDPSRVYRARDVSIDRAAFHIALEDGTIGFTSDVAGRVTGAFFQGEGEILLTPPDQAERASMMLHTGAAILEERFDGAYFRFNDDTFEQLQSSLSLAENGQEFVARWNQTAQSLAEQDALRLFVTFSEFLPGEKGGDQPAAPRKPAVGQDRFLRVRMQGRSRGTFDVYFDSNAPEQVWAGQLTTGASGTFYNVWTSYSLLKKRQDDEAANPIATEEGRASAIDISDFKIRAEIKPPTTLEAEAVLQLRVRKGGQRTFLFELARALVVRTVEADGHPLVFIHNPALEGSQLARRGNDLVAVVFPQAVQTGQLIRLRFVYSGDVLQEAGLGLLYVGARGTWYPNRGLAMSNFDLEFHYPPDWTLVATGKRVAQSSTADAPASGAGGQVSRWVSERPIPVAGFNLGKYQKVETRAGDVLVETYATRAMERAFPKAGATVMRDPSSSSPVIVVPPPPPPSPARNAQTVASASAHAIEFFARRFGPYPYGELALTQMPGNLSQGWPGLIFLSSLSFLTEDEQSALHFSPEAKADISIVIGHETAHQWWGDLVLWNDYRDQWLAEAVANYSSLMLIEAQDPGKFRGLMERYRDNLLETNQDGIPLMQDGAVSLGTRLSCSQFPNGYEAISYGRGTWLLHMLRFMLRDAESQPATGPSDAVDEPFVRVLHRLRDQYEGKAITTRQFLRLFEEELPRPLWYEGRRSLDWFYQGWVEGTSLPQYELKNVKYADSPDSTEVSGILLQKDAPDELVTPVPIYALQEGTTVRLQRVFADGPETAFHVRAPRGTRRVVVDPEQTLLLRKR